MAEAVRALLFGYALRGVLWDAAVLIGGLCGIIRGALRARSQLFTCQAGAGFVQWRRFGHTDLNSL